jgi:Family of unknown function (DUF6282)
MCGSATCDGGHSSRLREAEISRRAILVGAIAVGAGAALTGLIDPRETAAQVRNDPILDGVIDLHVHSDPDIRLRLRSLDDFETVSKFDEVGARGVLLKNHFMPTADRAYLVRKVVPGIDVFGGVCLNKAVGGLNPDAIQVMAQVKGGYGKMVWFPTFDAEHQLRRFPRNEAFVRTTDAGGELLPEARECLRVIAGENLAISTGHIAPHEALALFREARAMGITRLLVTHALSDPARFTVEQMQEVVSAGGMIEHVFLSALATSSPDPVPITRYVEAIRAVGAEHSIVSTDLGQAENPIHPMGLKVFIMELVKAGVTQQEIDLMTRVNPARLLDLT